ncbi:GTP pyrophosphokinase [Flavobacterium suzhouense]|uniref:GTP pyrophosphokinase family protein n=1 Tax=Flavobacterium suzhouense TaxID=1529638 RepID=A0ABW5NU82_9FLAO
MNKEEVQKDYLKNKHDHLKLAENLKHALEGFLVDNEISFHTVSFRIKEFESYQEKIERKGYDDPIEQIEDFCGLRIVCFYPTDLQRIAQVIAQEFDVIESIDKTGNFEPDRFGYRSHHYIVKIKEDWAKAPNYRNLENLKAEIQVRTILMHAWADIEHKLAYKKKEDIPIAFRRKLYQLSALLEIADGQFQDLKNEKEDFRKSLISENKGVFEFDVMQDLNLDSLQAYLDFKFPRHSIAEKSTGDLLEEFIEYDISLEEFDKMCTEIEDILPEVERKIRGKSWTLAQVGVARLVLDLKSEAYWISRQGDFPSPEWKNVVKKMRSEFSKK